MAVKNRLKVAKKALSTLHRDRDERLLLIDRYERGQQDAPWTPESADAEYIALTKRAITNIVPFMLSGPAQMMYVDSFRRGRRSDDLDTDPSEKLREVQPEWDHWQDSRLDARQAAVVRGALKFGHSFTLTELDEKKDKVLTKGLSALNTVALFEDPVNDEDPYVALTITRWPSTDEKGKLVNGLARMWDDTYAYWVEFKSLDDLEGVVVKGGKRHGASVCPVTRFAASVDLEGRTTGLVEPMIVLQDRINQTVFDLLIVQSFAAFKVRTISGMAPPVKMKAIDHEGMTIDNPAAVADDEIADWVPVIDPNTGRPVPAEINVNAKRLFFAEDHDTKFDTLDETPLDGFIKAIELAFRHMAALSQTPPHHILGEIANISAEALEAAETSLSRKVDELKASFGESWERVFRVAAEIGDYEGADDLSGEVVWRDVGHASLAQIADGLGKFAEALEIPKRGLWRRVPNVTANELAYWNELREEENPDQALATSTRRAGTGARPSFRLEAQPEPEVAA